MYDALTVEILDCLEQLIDCNAGIWFIKRSSFMLDIGDKVAACYKVLNDIADMLAR